MELNKLIRKRIEENVPDFDIRKVEQYEYLFEMIAIEFASEQVKLFRQPVVIKSVCENNKCKCQDAVNFNRLICPLCTPM